MNIENTKVYNIKDAMRAMRNPKKSWVKNDTKTVCDIEDGHITSCEIGPNDTTLSKALIKAGPEHRKFMRQIFVSVDFILPNYLTNEFDTYKLGTTRNSCSLQHTGAKRDFNVEDFSFDDINNPDVKTVIDIINKYRRKYMETNNYDDFRIFRQFVGMNFNYQFTWTANYEVLLNMYRQRKTHRLKEWHTICDWIKSLPGMNVFLGE